MKFNIKMISLFLVLFIVLVCIASVSAESSNSTSVISDNSGSISSFSSSVSSNSASFVTTTNVNSNKSLKEDSQSVTVKHESNNQIQKKVISKNITQSNNKLKAVKSSLPVDPYNVTVIGNNVRTVNDWNSLHEAITDQEDQGNLTVYLQKGTYYTNDPLEINSNVNLIGEKGVVYSYNPYSSNNAIKVNKGTLTIRNINFINSNTKNGRMIFVDGNAQLNVYNSTFADINSNALGAVVYNNGGFIRLVNSNFYNNTASAGGALYNNRGTMVINNCKFMSNTNNIDSNDVEYLGGSIFNKGYITVTDSLFKYNDAGFGGVIYNMNYLKIVHSTLTENHATEGGVIYNTGAVSILNSTLNNNHATYGGVLYTTAGNLYINNSNFYNNYALYVYAVIYNDNSIINIDNSRINNNWGSEGGAIKNEGIMTISNTQINNNEEIGNNFHLWGGAISNEGRLTLIKCTLNNNKATDGGAIYNEGYLNIQKSTLSKNSIEVTIEENDYSYSLVKGNGGAIYNIGTLIINNSSLYSNSIKVYNDTGDNPGYGYGGAICSEDGTVTITNSQINYNTADYGGAISIMNGTMTLKNNNINYNTAKGTGGAISTFDEESNYGDFKLNIINCNINYNYAKGDGGAIWNGEWVYVGGDVTIINSKINNNKANQDAGAICNSGYMKITSSSINNNKVTDKDGFGGAIFNTYDLNITNCKFNNNSAVYGGAIANPTDVTITSSVFTNNKANYGGAIYTAGGQGNGYLNVTYSTFLSNGKYDVYNGNDEYTLKNVHCDYNWWGTNNNPLTRLYNCSTTKWIYMQLGTFTTKSKNTLRISLDLNYYTNGKTISRITGTKHVQGITVKITIKSRHLNGVYTGIINNGVYTISKKVNYKELITLTGYTPNKTITKTVKAT